MRTSLCAILLAFCTASVVGCGSKSSDSNAQNAAPLIVNGNVCRCDAGGTLCVTHTSATATAPTPPTCQALAQGCTDGCRCFSSTAQQCWPSPGVSGLCVCTALPQGDALAQH